VAEEGKEERGGFLLPLAGIVSGDNVADNLPRNGDRVAVSETSWRLLRQCGGRGKISISNQFFRSIYDYSTQN